jgi:hypothetical protein
VIPRRAIRRLALLVVLVATVRGALAPGVEAKDKKKDEQVLPVVHCNEVLVRDGVAYLAQTSGLTLMDVSEPARPRELGRLGVPATLTGVAAEGHMAYLAAGAHGLYIADLEDPAAPRLVQRFDTPGRVLQVLARNGLAYLADHREGLRVVDVSDAERPIHKARIPTRDVVRAIALRGNTLAAAEGKAGVRLFELRSDGVPRETRLLRGIEDARDVALVDGLLLVAAAKRGMLVYALEEDGPAPLSEFQPIRSAQYVSASGTLAMVSNGVAEVQVVDLREPRNPLLWAGVQVNRNYPALRIDIEENVAFVAADLGGLAVIDLEHPQLPEVLVPRKKREMKVSFPR